ncbi:MAG: type II toxin-antitoxin system VapC family toxin [Actinobacteria bacterium]|nr:type II toxin-antitoxin system VapC family toxin [Actinomycetota bacterium]
MILVDTSIWIDHLHRADRTLTTLLEQDECAAHEYVIEELALGSMAQRTEVLSLLGNLHRLPRLTHGELLTLVGRHALQSRGLSVVDVHLLGSVLISPGAALWTRDKRLLSACHDVGVATFGG